MKNELKQVVEIAGKALEAEDKLFLNAIATNKVAYPSAQGGILRINNERYYQFIIARALIHSHSLTTSVEVNSHDLVLSYPNNPSQHFAAIEIKRYMSKTGEQEIPGIMRDIYEKLLNSKAENNLMLILSANPRGKTNTELGWLAKRLQLSPVEDHSIWHSYCFPTTNYQGVEVDFWVAGYEISNSNIAFNKDSFQRCFASLKTAC